MSDLSPGTILQRLYLGSRLQDLSGKTFCEIGCGRGELANWLLNKGMSGRGYELNQAACEINAQRNKDFIEAGTYHIAREDFFKNPPQELYDTLISSMVIEHLPEEKEMEYFQLCRQLLKSGGRIVVLVPANMKFWSELDEWGGHYRRYDRQRLREVAMEHQFKLVDLAGLTFPVSNILFKLNKYRMKRYHQPMPDSDKQKRTQHSSDQMYLYNTYPSILTLLLNRFTLYPFHLLQLFFRDHPDALVLYAEYMVQQSMPTDVHTRN